MKTTIAFGNGYTYSSAVLRIGIDDVDNFFMSFFEWIFLNKFFAHGGWKKYDEKLAVWDKGELCCIQSCQLGGLKKILGDWCNCDKISKDPTKFIGPNKKFKRHLHTTQKISG